MLQICANADAKLCPPAQKLTIVNIGYRYNLLIGDG